MTFPELSETVSCPTTTAVTQTGAQLTIAPFILSGACGGLSVPFGAALIDGQGAFVAATSGATENTNLCVLRGYTLCSWWRRSQSTKRRTPSSQAVFGL